MENGSQGSGAGVWQELVQIMRQILAAQILNAYYGLLASARQRGDQRDDQEIFRDCMADFLVIGQMISRVQGDLGQLDPEELVKRLGGRS